MKIIVEKLAILGATTVGFRGHPSGYMGAVAAALLASAGPAAAGPLADVPEQAAIETIEVVTTPLIGVGINPGKLPIDVQSLSARDLTLEGTPSLLRGMEDLAGSVNLNSTLGDDFQPDILYRGFTASPALGTPEGLAVYQNGVRINEAFGDTVNWDLIPDIAIDRLDLVSANPVFGLNALGGAVLLTMKSGFTYRGFEAEGGGGTFGQRDGELEYGIQRGDLGVYVAARIYGSNGWRQFSRDTVRQLYADLGYHGDRLSFDIAYSGADNSLDGEGTTPQQSLEVNRRLDFTTPQNNANRLGFVAAHGSFEATNEVSVQANVYRRSFHQYVINGNTTNYTTCSSGNGLLCQADGMTPLATASGAPIPDISNGGTVPIGEDDGEVIQTVTTGGAAQITDTGPVFGLANQFIVGGGVDHASINFQSSAEVGIINASLQVLPSGYFVDTPENTPFTATPVNLDATNDDTSVFATDTVNVTSALAVTASGRYNIARIHLTDLLGTALSGTSTYRRFNPAIGATYAVTSRLTIYAGYAESNRVPTPSEIECSNPQAPCLLPSSLSSDPPNLKQVVSHTVEAGLRGSVDLRPADTGALTWKLGAFHTQLDHDIYGIATSLSAGYFQNIGATRREGIEGALTYKSSRLSVFLNYSLVDATFCSTFTIPSSSNPLADANGTITVVPGDRLPGIPVHQLKVGADFNITPSWTVGGVLNYFSDQYLRGDEANLTPTLPGYAVLNLHSTYRFGQHVELFANLSNALDAHYSTFGEYGDPTGVNAPGVPTNGVGVNNRFLSPAPPIAIFGGTRVEF